MRGCVLGVRRRTFARVRSGRGGLTCEPGTVRSFREPSIWRGATFARIVVRERRYVLAPGADTERLAAQ